MAARPNLTRVWLFMGDGRNTRDMRDLDHLEAIQWGANPHARRGDLVLMYRTAPYSDIAYIFRAASDPTPTRPGDEADATHVIDLDEKVALAAPIAFETLRSERALKKRWSFVKVARGEMRWRRDLVALGVWPALSALIMRHNRSLDLERLAHRDAIESRSAFRWRGLRVFFSYAHADRARTRSMYDRLSRLRGVEVWRDDRRLVPGMTWEPVIERAIQASDVVVVCLSRRALQRGGYVRQEIEVALDAANQRSAGLSIIPVKLEECRPDPRLRRWQWVSMSDGDGMKKLLGAVRGRARRRSSGT
jgi:TIR domain